MIVQVNDSIPLELKITDLFGQERTDISSVSVRIYHRESGVVVEDLAPTAMSGSGSLWHYNFVAGIATEGTYTIEYTITDNDTEEYYQDDNLTVESVVSGGATLPEIEGSTVLAKQATLVSMSADVEFIKQVESGKWQIVSNQMIFYKTTGEELMRFNLFDESGNPTMENVLKRERV